MGEYRDKEAKEAEHRQFVSQYVAAYLAASDVMDKDFESMEDVVAIAESIWKEYEQTLRERDDRAKETT